MQGADLTILERRFKLIGANGEVIAKIYGVGDYVPGRSGAVREWQVCYPDRGDEVSMENIFDTFGQMQRFLSAKFFDGDIERFSECLFEITSGKGSSV